MREISAIVHGRVQMVMFRDFTKRHARTLGLTGFVRNLKDGTVEVVAQGEQSALNQLVEKLRHGSLISRVDSVDTAWREPTEHFDGFHIAY